MLSVLVFVLNGLQIAPIERISHLKHSNETLAIWNKPEIAKGALNSA
jgi:hypothetical protein